MKIYFTICSCPLMYSIFSFIYMFVCVFVRVCVNFKGWRWMFQLFPVMQVFDTVTQFLHTRRACTLKNLLLNSWKHNTISLSRHKQVCLTSTHHILKQLCCITIAYKKANEWYIKLRKTLSGTTSDNEWQGMTASDNECQIVVVLANFPFSQIREEPTAMHLKDTF